MIPKFRAWDNDEECMVYQSDNGDEYIWDIGAYDVWICYICDGEIPEQILMQSTGLKDKNGVEIFEGDVVLFSISDDFGHFDGEKAIVQASEFHSGLVCKLVNLDLEYRIFYDPVFHTDYEVIGNIYENSDLVEYGK